MKTATVFFVHKVKKNPKSSSLQRIVFDEMIVEGETQELANFNAECVVSSLNENEEISAHVL